MSKSIELYGLFVLTILGFTLPLVTLLLTLFPEGTKALRLKSENERKQNEDNLISETQKKESDKSLDLGALEKTIDTLKKQKRQAETKLRYLSPTNLFLTISLPFAAAFVAILVAIGTGSRSTLFVSLSTSVISVGIGFYALYTSITVLVEVTEIVSSRRTSVEERIVELLSDLVEKSGAEGLYLKKGDAKILFANEPLEPSTVHTFSVNKKHHIPISFINSSLAMAKKVEVGFIFPKDFLVEKTDKYRIYTDESMQIVRFNNEIISGWERMNLYGLDVTFLNVGLYEITAFVKGENIKYERVIFKLKVVE